MPGRFARDLLPIYISAFLRSLGVGLMGVVLGVYLYRDGLDSTRIGFVLAAGLAGGTLATALAGYRADRIGRRRVLFGVSLLACVGGVGLALAHSFAFLMLLAFFGMLNGMGSDRSANYALEQAIIPGLVSESGRTWALSWYNVCIDGGGALGALAGGLPVVLHARANVDLNRAYGYVFFAYAGLHLLNALVYLALTRAAEVAPLPTVEATRVTAESKRIVRRLAALFSLDSFGGGFLGDALVAYWFFRRFGVDERELGILFFAVHLLNAASHLGAAWLAKRIGLVNTMVFTHLPSSLLLIAVPFAPSVKIAMVLFLMRESLVEMDVPTRQSYLAAMVQPHERSYASAITNLTRTVSWATASSVAGAIMQNLAFGAPLVLGGTCKIVYDLLLFRGFRHLKPPEERSLRA